MSEINQPVNTANQLTTDYDVSKIFIYENRFETGSFNNDTYDPVTLQAGTVMGRNKTTGKILPLQSNATDGSKYPVGILNKTTTVNEGDTVDLAFCVAGDVAEEKVILVKDGDTLETIVDNRRLRDRIAADTVGIKLVASTELTVADNS